MAKISATLVEQQDRGEELRLGRALDRNQVPGQDRSKVGAGDDFAVQLALPLIERFLKLARKCHPDPLQNFSFILVPWSCRSVSYTHLRPTRLLSISYA